MAGSLSVQNKQRNPVGEVRGYSTGSSGKLAGLLKWGIVRDTDPSYMKTHGSQHEDTR